MPDLVFRTMRLHTPLRIEQYDAMIDLAKQLQQCLDVEIAVKSENRTAAQEMLEQFILAKDAIIGVRKILQNNPNMEKSQIAARKRLLKALTTLITTYNS